MSQLNVVIAWDPEVVSAEDYVELVTALGDLVRQEGGAGIRRVYSGGTDQSGTVIMREDPPCP